MHFPSGEVWWRVTADALHWNVEALVHVTEFLRNHNTAQFVVLHDGALVVDESWNSSPTQAGDVYAVQKSVIALLLGAAQDRRLLRIDDATIDHLPVGWTRLPAVDERRLTLRHLLNMTTGMDDSLGQSGEIGVTWRYNNTAYNYVKRVLERRSGMDLQALTESWLLRPLGITDTRWVDRGRVLPDGRHVSGLETTARTMARLGLLVLAGGSWAGQTVVRDRHYWGELFLPGSLANPAWCLAWRRNDQERFMEPLVDRTFKGRWIPEAPGDLVGAQGAGDNRIYVVPTLGLVIARRGDWGFGRRSSLRFDCEFWRLFRGVVKAHA